MNLKFWSLLIVSFELYFKRNIVACKEGKSLMKEFCEVIIIVNNGIPAGLITGLQQNISFNPINILPELRYKIEEIEHGDIDFDAFDYAFEYAFEHIIKVDNRDQYTALVLAIKKILVESSTSHKYFDLAQIELLKSYFDITFHFTPIRTISNPMKVFAPSLPKYVDSPVHYSHYSVDSALNFKASDYHEYFYQCYSLSDAIFSIWHFLALNKYKFNKCKHCGRYFATKSYKQEYCSRNSTYPKKEEYTCYEAVKRIRQDLNRQHRAIYQNLYANYTKDHLETFEKAFTDAFMDVKDHSDYSTIDSCYAILSKDKWYTKPSIRNIGVKDKL